MDDGKKTDGQDGAAQTRRSGWTRFWFAVKVIEVRLRFVALLVLTGFTITYWDHIQVWWEKRSRQQAVVQKAVSEFEFFCPMHTFIIRDDAGKCPICGMPLVQRRKGDEQALPEGVVGRVQASPERIAQAGVKTVPVEYRILARQVRAVGTVDFNERTMARITARFPGRIEKLHANYEGVSVAKGDPVVRIYSPKYLAATQEFLQAVQLARGVSSGASPEERKRMAAMAEYSRQRLLLAGFEPGQLAEIEKSGTATDIITYYSKIGGVVVARNVVEGEYVDEGQALFTVADLSNVWIQLQVPESDAALARDGAPVQLQTVAYPGEVFYGNIGFVSPLVDANTRTLRVRVEAMNPDGKLRPGMYMTAVMRASVGRVEKVADDTTGMPAMTGTLHAGHETTGVVEYYCEMHPEIVRPEPGDCPKCGMHLTRRVVPVKHDTHVTSPTQAEGAAAYICTMCPEVKSDKPGECPKCGMKLVPNAESKDEEAARWAEGYSCPMHPEELNAAPGVCSVCPCGMRTEKTRVEKVLAIPELSVIDTGTRKIVYVEQAPGVYDAKEVLLGLRAGRYYPVLDGLKEGEMVAAAGSFLLDAETRLNPVPGSMYAAEQTTAAKAEPVSHDHSAHQH